MYLNVERRGVLLGGVDVVGEGGAGAAARRRGPLALGLLGAGQAPRVAVLRPEV